jgi:site-specific DNA-cytosine methylase
MTHLFPYKWYLKDGYPSKNIEPNKYNVFGTFICGGGSTMGYKLAGFNHFGGVEIDNQVADVYKTNHNPEYLIGMSVPPVMTAQISNQIKIQWLDKIQ